MLPHNSGERYDVLGKVTVPLGTRQVVRLTGILSDAQRLLFDPVLKYAPGVGSGERLTGRLAMLHLRHASPPEAGTTLVADLRAGYFDKEALRAPVLDAPDREFGGFTFARWSFAGEEIAQSRDTVTAADAIPGFREPERAAEPTSGSAESTLRSESRPSRGSRPTARSRTPCPHPRARGSIRIRPRGMSSSSTVRETSP